MLCWFFFEWNQFTWWHCSIGRVCTKRSQVQRWSTHRTILAPKILIYHFSSFSFKITFGIIYFLWPRPAHSIYRNFTNTMNRQDTVRYIRQPSCYGSGNEDRPKFIWCVDGLQPQIHEIWTFSEDGVTHEVHPKKQVAVRTGFIVEFATNYVTLSWCRVPVWQKFYEWKFQMVGHS